MMVVCEAVVSGTWEYARVKTMPCFANASRFGVSARSEPRKSMRSARVVSRVMRMMLGCRDGAFELFCGGLAAIAEPKQTRTENQRKNRIRKRESTIGRLPRNSCPAGSEDELDAEVHIPRAALRNHRIASSH